jgi:hypothetical protein
MAIRGVDHLHARAHPTRQREDAHAGGEAPCRERVAHVIGAPVRDAGSIGQVSTLYKQLCPLVPGGHGPSSTAVIVRRREQALEYLVLGDSALLVQAGDGDVYHHSDKRLRTIAPDVRNSIHQGLHDGCGYDHAAHRDRLRALHAAERAMRNRDDGYWIAGDDPRAALHSLTGHYSLTDNAAGARRVVLLSDGIERGITHLHLYSDAHELLDSLFDPGTLATITRVRHAELADPRGSQHPRTHPATPPPPSRAC